VSHKRSNSESLENFRRGNSISIARFARRLATYLFPIFLFLSRMFVASYSPLFPVDLISPGSRETPRQVISTSFSPRAWEGNKKSAKSEPESVSSSSREYFALGDHVDSSKNGRRGEFSCKDSCEMIGHEGMTFAVIFFIAFSTLLMNWIWSYLIRIKCNLL